MKKFVLISVPLIIAGIFIFIFSYTYTVEKSVSDIATKQPIEGVDLKIGGRESATNEEGRYKISGIKIFERRHLEVLSHNDYEDSEAINIDYSSRFTTKDINLEPTIEKLFGFISNASKSGQYDYLWDLMHPDDKKYWGSKDSYLDLLKERDDLQFELLSLSIKSEKIGNNIRELDEWEHKVTGKKYKGVLEVPSEIILLEDGKEQIKNELTYYKKVDGFYHYFTGVDKEELKQAIKDVKALL